ncbi:MAG: head decoration protein [Campylobacterota bacterium]|nr:head decoration protein [Campylobacterota bacterium]
MVTEGKHTAEYIISEANGERSRGTGTVLSGQSIDVGELVGIETASGKYVAYDPADTIVGSSTVAGISYAAVDATLADKTGAVFTLRDSEVRSSDLTYNEAVADVITAEVAGLVSLGIIVR